ncbi:protoglobin domain-containing protein [Granulicella sp. L46]|uniref:protoglobin domain-containing protein n=1 Tax=Granulicella sp. L46 TaxID=1641865 RepID=UPI00131C7539|nr:protoglobin domain-containing protein [Granulicella sp. L46]
MNRPDPSAPSSIPGYDYGTPGSAVSSVTERDLSELEQAAGWTARDAEVLARHADVFRANAESMVDAWRSVIGSQPHLSRWFVGPDGKPDDEYKMSIKRRFVQWVIDAAVRPHDQDWLNYQQEIGLRHTPAKKNKTDAADTPPLVPFRYLLGFIPVVLPIRGFFKDAIQDEAELNKLQEAWTKAVLLHVTLWSRAYVAEDLW